MKTSIFSLGAALMLFSGLALAQPDAANGGKAQNPANWNMGGGRGGRNALTTAQRDQLAAQNAQIRDLTQRQTLTYAGVTDTKAQDAILAFLKAQDTAREGLQQKWFQLVQTARGDNANNTVLVTQLNALRDAVDEEKARRTKALADLDAQIGFSKDPKLDASLMIAGITGDEATFVNGSTNNATGGGRGNIMTMLGGMMGGFDLGGMMGGFGGGNGGPRGGGGRNGGPGGGGPGGGGPNGGGGGNDAPPPPPPPDGN